MRDIKFRAWIIPDQSDPLDFGMVYVKQIMFEPFDPKGNSIILDKDNYTHLLSKCILMQYTGLKDGNGKEIYEGDIVEYNSFLRDVELMYGEAYDITKDTAYWTIKKTIVEYQDYGFSPFKDIFKGEKLKHSEGFTVIGNIYENPELLKEG